jgi:response regulator RpfG family c-di-GMP phosphodiesterase
VPRGARSASPHAILRETEPLTEAEWALAKQHATLGALREVLGREGSISVVTTR